MILLDTDTLTHFSYGKNPKLRNRIEQVPDDEILAITVITYYEVLRGRGENLLKAADKQQLQQATLRFQQAQKLLAKFPVLHFDDQSIEKFSLLRNQKTLNKMGRADLLIASIALANNALLVTRNLKDYRNIANLQVENWVD